MSDLNIFYKEEKNEIVIIDNTSGTIKAIFKNVTKVLSSLQLKHFVFLEENKTSKRICIGDHNGAFFRIPITLEYIFHVIRALVTDNNKIYLLTNKQIIFQYEFFYVSDKIKIPRNLIKILYFQECITFIWSSPQLLDDFIVKKSVEFKNEDETDEEQDEIIIKNLIKKDDEDEEGDDEENDKNKIKCLETKTLNIKILQDKKFKILLNAIEVGLEKFGGFFVHSRSLYNVEDNFNLIKDYFSEKKVNLKVEIEACGLLIRLCRN